MRLALFGGVFGSPMSEYALSAPEVVLNRYLTEAGLDVVTVSSNEDPFKTAADVHHIHHLGPGAYAAALGGLHPFVFTSHNPFLVSDLDSDESRLERALATRVFRAADAVVALSSREAELLSARFGVPRERFVVVPNGLDLSLYGPSDAPRSGPLRLLSVGQLAPYKGHIYLLEALARLAPRFPDLRLTIVSHAHDSRNEVVQRSTELGISERVQFEGPLGTRELVEQYRACDVYVQPSLAECFPVTVLEAMACARPVIATDVGGVREEVGAAAIVVPPGDSSALEAAIERLLVDGGERASLGRAAHERARTLYDGTRIAAEHIRLYDSVIGASGRSSAVRRAATAAAIGLYRRRGSIARYVPTRVRRRRAGTNSSMSAGSSSSAPSSSS